MFGVSHYEHCFTQTYKPQKCHIKLPFLQIKSCEVAQLCFELNVRVFFWTMLEKQKVILSHQNLIKGLEKVKECQF